MSDTTEMGSTMRALDLFAGTGWGVACQRLGIEEYGVEIMPAAVATREANGMTTIYRDVWDGLTDPSIVPDHDILIASPPCQTFSMAGSGAGRRALDDVLALIESKVYGHPDELQALTELSGFDDKTALVLTPLTYAVQWKPTYIAWEQVPTVLPVWEACADVLREIGYSVKTGIIHSEQYGVPQTRKRAYLVARNDGHEAAFPAPTHSRYYSHQPAKLDAGVEKWVTMAEALGWGMDARPYPTVSTGAGTAGGGTDPAALGGSGARKNVYAERAAGRWVPSGDADNDSDGHTLRLTTVEAALLQSYPAYVVPADRLPNGGDASWVNRRPSPTIIGSFRPDVVAAPGYRKPGDPPRQKTPGSVLVTEEEAAVLQSYDRPFVWCGTRTQQFLQIGNAVPPLVAQAVIEAVTSQSLAADDALFTLVKVPA